jgi:hypothetical protein
VEQTSRDAVVLTTRQPAPPWGLLDRDRLAAVRADEACVARDFEARSSLPCVPRRRLMKMQSRRTPREAAGG